MFCYCKIMNQIDLHFSLGSHYSYKIGHTLVSFGPRGLATCKVKQKSNKTNELHTSQLIDPNSHDMRVLATD